MKILVLDTAASESGALTVLKNVMSTAENLNDNVEWHFIVSQNFSSAYNKIHILEYPWAKKSWFHRLYFDYIVLPRIIKKEKYEKILSLQNTKVPRTNIRQYIYLHQSLPFIDFRFSLKNEPKLWIYQNIISKIIIKSIRDSKLVFVQTNWMKNAIVKYKNDERSIRVISPSVDMEYIKKNDATLTNGNLFFPATAFKYKNHRILLEAVSLLSQEEKRNITFTFTLEGNENDEISKIKHEFEVQGVVVNWIGLLNKQELFEKYKSHVLIFPSYVETFGLPLLEAKLSNSFIIASDTLFSHEILHDYPNKVYFKHNDATELAQILRTINNRSIVPITRDVTSTNSWRELLNMVIRD